MSNSTKIVHCKKDKYDIYIGRPSQWGNPYSHIPGKGEFTVSSREEAIDKYREHLLNSPHLLSSLYILDGKILGCWCKPLSCHGDVLIEFIEKLQFECDICFKLFDNKQLLDEHNKIPHSLDQMRRVD